MPDQIVEAIAPLFAFFGLGTFTLIGMRMWLNAKAQRQRSVPPEQLDRLLEVVDRMDEEVRRLGEELSELHERVDFTERVLTEGKGKAGRTTPV
jgi:hypothetical protein